MKADSPKPFLNTPDWCTDRQAQVAELVRSQGSAKVDELAVQLLREVFLTNIKNMMSKTKSIAELNQRTEVSIFDLLKVLESDGYDVSDLVGYSRKNRDRFKDSKEISDSREWGNLQRF